MKKVLNALFLPLVILLLLTFSACRRQAPEKQPLLCYVGGTMRPAIEEIARNYEKKTGQPVEIDYADSGELLIKIEQTGRGDLFVCHDPFEAGARQRGLERRSWTLATMTPGIVVKKGNPKNIRGLRDLTRPGLRIVLTDAEYSTTGHIVDRMLQKSGLTNMLANVVSRTRGGGAAANAVIMGTADAAIVWDAVARLRSDKLDYIPIEDDIRLKPGIDAVTSPTFNRIDMSTIKVTITSLKTSRQPEAADAFAEFAASKESRKVWENYGFDPPPQIDGGSSKPQSPGKIGRGRPTLQPSGAQSSSAAPRLNNFKNQTILVYCAAGMRLPISKAVQEFEKASGCRVELAFDGSNRLLGQIKLTRKGDLYIAGDTDYIAMARKTGLTQKTATLCWFVPVIITRKGNQKEIHTLQYMTTPGIRIGQGDPQAAAIGRLLPEILKLNQVDLNAWQKNVVMNTPTVNELAIAITLGTIDAAVVWDAIAAKYRDKAEIITIPENICPEVGAAVLTFSKHRAAAEAFLNFLTSETGRAILRENGYTVQKPQTAK